MRRQLLAAAAALFVAAPAFCSFQFVIAGRVEAVNPDNNAVVVRDLETGRASTVFVHPKVTKELKAGQKITAVLEPRSAVAQSVDVDRRSETGQKRPSQEVQ